jgi:hypothetical protein
MVRSIVVFLGRTVCPAITLEGIVVLASTVNADGPTLVMQL